MECNMSHQIKFLLRNLKIKKYIYIAPTNLEFSILGLWKWKKMGCLDSCYMPLTLIPMVINQNPNIWIKKKPWLHTGVLFIFLWCSQTGHHHPHEDLATFGNRPDMKGIILTNPFINWATCMNVMQKSGTFIITIIIILKSGELISAILFTKIHCMCQNHNLINTGTYISLRTSGYHIPSSW